MSPTKPRFVTPHAEKELGVGNLERKRDLYSRQNHPRMYLIGTILFIVILIIDSIGVFPAYYQSRSMTLSRTRPSL
jgi:hypothetical protein